MVYKEVANKKLYENLKIDCKNCFGFCCAALFFSASEGFPENKKAGKPCVNLKKDFSCAIHKELRNKGLKGCTAYDCFGAGQKVAQKTFGGESWYQSPELKNKMFDVFLIMRELHEMLWYLIECLRQESSKPIHEKLKLMIDETEKLTYLNSEDIIKVSIETHRNKVNELLHQTSDLVRSKIVNKNVKNFSKGQKMLAGRLDYIGANLRNSNLRGVDLRGAFLIAADLRGVNLLGTNLIGADLRDADIRGANLSGAIFITQGQINTAKGDSTTRLPKELSAPSYWGK